MAHQKNQKSTAKRSLKRKLEKEFEFKSDDREDRKKIASSSPQRVIAEEDLEPEIRTHVGILNSTYSFAEIDRAAAKSAASFLAELAKNGMNFSGLYLFSVPSSFV